jgi:hypothetical protein
VIIMPLSGPPGLRQSHFEVGFQGGAELGQMQVAADAAESMTSFKHGSARQRSSIRHRASA